MNLIQLIRLEWLKYKNNRTFIVSLIMFAIFLPGSVMITLSIGDLPEPFPKPGSFFNMPEIWGFIGYAGNWLAYFIFGFLGVYMITLETSNRTLRQGVINGLRRHNLISGKLLFLVLIALAATIYYIIIGLLLASFGTEPYEGSPFFGEDFIIFRFFLMVLSYLIFGFLIGLIARKMGLGILIYFMWVFFIESAIRWLVHYQLYEHRSMIYYPMNAVEDLTPSPLYKFAEFTANGDGMDISNFLMSPTEAIVTSVVYIVLFGAVCYQLVLKRDL